MLKNKTGAQCCEVGEVIPLSELAFAYELRQEGLSWRCIAIGLGRDRKQLANAVRRRLLPDDAKTIN